MDVKIYVLIDPRTNEYRYIGKTVVSLKERLRGHFSQSMRTKKPGHKENWIRGLLAKNVKPVIKVIEVCSEENWQDRERYWIAFGKKEGWPITNLSPGGDGWHGPRHNDEFKKELSEKMKGNNYSIGVKWTDEQRELLMKSRSSPWNKGLKGAQRFSRETRMKKSLRMRGQKHPMSKLSDCDVIKMRERFSQGEAPKSIADGYKINYSHCVKIVTNKSRKICVPS